MGLSKFLDPKNDVAFKRVFGSESNKNILIPNLEIKGKVITGDTMLVQEALCSTITEASGD